MLEAGPIDPPGGDGTAETSATILQPKWLQGTGSGRISWTQSMVSAQVSELDNTNVIQLDPYRPGS